MPFPLAHPAAVLPLRRCCPRWLHFPALVMGSISPDLGYLFGPLRADAFAHHFYGSFGFSLPVGLLVLVLLYALHPRVCKLLPARSRTLLPAELQPLRPWTPVVFSLLIGSWTHLLMDSCTNEHGWVVRHFPVLETTVGYLGQHPVRVDRILWFALSFVGVFLVALAYVRRNRPAHQPKSSRAGWTSWGEALLAAILVLPIGFLHHIVRNPLGMVLVGSATLVLVCIIAWRATSTSPS